MVSVGTDVAVSTAAGLDWRGSRPEPGERVLVLAPHPDDEVIGAAGLMTWLRGLAVPVTVVAVTDGEASHPGSSLIRPDQLREIRAAERAAALATLGLSPDVVRLGLPDGSVGNHLDSLVAELCQRSDSVTTLVAPWTLDGHPDHEAVGWAARRAAGRTGATVWEVPIWAKVRSPGAFARVGAGDPDGESVGRLQLSTARAAEKREALACHRSQLRPLGPAGADGPVIHPFELAGFLDGVEEVRWR